MTYNQIVSKVQTLMESHPMVKSVRFASPTEWLFRDEQPMFPNCSFICNTGSFNFGRDLQYQFQFWFLDKSGVDGEYEKDVVSDMHGIANDLISVLRKDLQITIDTSITWNAISEKFEDYLSGVTLTLNINITDSNPNCSFPS